MSKPEEVTPEVMRKDITSTAADICAEAVTYQYRKAIAGTLEMLRFGAMLIEVNLVVSQCENSKTARHSPNGDIPSLKSWLAEHCPEINYKTAMRFKALAENMQEHCQVPAKLPLLLALPLLDGSTHVDDLPAKVNKDRAVAIQQKIWSMVNGTSARQLQFQFQTEQPPRGGDHGGGAAVRRKALSENEYETIQAHEQWQLIIQYLREFAIHKKRHIHIAPDRLAADMASINECLRIINSAIKKG